MPADGRWDLNGCLKGLLTDWSA